MHHLYFTSVLFRKLSIKIFNYILISSFCVVLVISCSNNSSISNSTISEKPNIVFIMADDHAYQAISAYGSPLAKLAPTPNIDRIAKNGMLMNAAYCTNSICGPSRASILTGNYSHVNGFFKNEGGGDFNSDLQTFPKIFQKNNYQTAIVGKWHLGTEPKGFDYSKVLVNWWGQGTYYNAEFCINGKDTVTETLRHSTKVIEDDCIAWLDQRDTTKPFLLMYQFKAPHRDWVPDSMYKDLFDGIEFPEPTTFNDDYEGRLAASENMMEIENHLNRRDLKQVVPDSLSGRDSIKWLIYGDNGQYWSPHDSLVGPELKKWKYQTYIKNYLKCIAGVDRAVGRLLDYLERNKLSENTIVVYTSDQGFYLGEHGWFDKRWMYEESFKMPFLIQYPKLIEPAKVSNKFILNVDFAPTLLDFAGIDIPNDMQGKSFRKMFIDSSYINHNEIYYHYYEYPKWHKVQPHFGIRTSKYKLIHYYYSMDEWELFDLQNDPNEMHNIYNQVDDTLKIKLKSKLIQLQEKYGDNQSLTEMKLMTDTLIERSYKGF